MCNVMCGVNLAQLLSDSVGVPASRKWQQNRPAGPFVLVQNDGKVRWQIKEVFCIEPVQQVPINDSIQRPDLVAVGLKHKKPGINMACVSRLSSAQFSLRFIMACMCLLRMPPLPPTERRQLYCPWRQGRHANVAGDGGVCIQHQQRVPLLQLPRPYLCSSSSNSPSINLWR